MNSDPFCFILFKMCKSKTVERLLLFFTAHVFLRKRFLLLFKGGRLYQGKQCSVSLCPTFLTLFVDFYEEQINCISIKQYSQAP